MDPLKKFKSYMYDKWSPTTKLMFYLAIISVLVGLFFGGKYVIDLNTGNQINIENSTLVDSPIIQSSPYSNISISYSDVEDDTKLVTNIHKKELTMTNNYFAYDGDKQVERQLGYYDLFNVKVILPSKQELFIDNFPHNDTKVIAYCNVENSDCYILYRYRGNPDITDKDICFVVTINDTLNTLVERGDKFFTDRSSCYKKAYPGEDYLIYWG